MNKTDVLIVGAGFSGLYLLDQLRKANFNVKIVESAPELGGVWYWNSYPGARVDTHSTIYQYSNEDLWSKWNYSELYPEYKEIRQYFQFVDQQLDLSKDIMFNTKVLSADFDSKENVWNILLDSNDIIQAKYFIVSTGNNGKPFIPDYQGIDTFDGEIYHTAKWPQKEVDLSNKRVAVIGTGASGVQVIQAIANKVKELVVFQRSPNMALPAALKKISLEASAELKKTFRDRFDFCKQTHTGIDYDLIYNVRSSALTKEQRETVYKDLWKQGGFRPLLGTFADIFVNQTANFHAYSYWRQQTIPRIKDSNTAEKLAPKIPPYLYGTKRPALEQNYFEIFNQNNVTLVDVNQNPIIEITQTGIKTKEIQYDVDVIIMATGFDAITGSILNIKITNDFQESLADKWKQGTKTYLGLATNGFPNLFYTTGPQGPTSYCNGIICTEIVGDWITNCLIYLRDNSINRIEATKKSEENWGEHLRATTKHLLMIHTKSWYLGANIPGKVNELLVYPLGLPAYKEKALNCLKNNLQGFTLT